VTARARAAAPDDLRDELVAAIAVHEDRPPEGFGDVWRVRSDADAAAFVERHDGRVRALLLFEVAHEGAATEAMRTVARQAGLEGELEGWLRRMGAE
jgi:hypothetical protein